MGKKKEKDEAIHPTFKLQAKEYTRVQKQVSKIITEWIPTLGLSHWEFDIEYVPGYHQDGPEVKACINPQAEYQNACARFFLPALIQDDFNSMEDTAVHELVHCLISPLMGKKARREDVEFVVVNTTKALIRAKYGLK